MNGAPSSRSIAAVVAASVVLAFLGCGGGAEPKPPELTGAPSTPERVAVQASDVPAGLQRCDYSAPMAAYIDGIGKLNSNASASISETWMVLQAAGAVAGYIAVYAETPAGCEQWITGKDGNYVTGASRVVSTVVVKFEDPEAAGAAYRADLFKQSALAGQPGLRVLVGSATGLSPNSVIGAAEETQPSVHRAIWQQGSFNIFFNSRNLTRAEFTAATSSENRRAE